MQKGKGNVNTKWYRKSKKKYKISTPDQLAGLARLVSNGVSFKGKTIKLMKNIDLRKYKNWKPIGTGGWNVKTRKAFSGTFDGNKKTVYNLVAKYQFSSNVGLFGFTDAKSKIKKLSVKNGNVLGYCKVGGIVGSSTSYIKNCRNYGRIKGTSHVGGILGGGEGNTSLKTRIIKCVNAGYITGNYDVGGILGNPGNIRRTATCSIVGCKNTGNISAANYAAGILGNISPNDVPSVISRCKNLGEIRVILLTDVKAQITTNNQVIVN